MKLKTFIALLILLGGVGGSFWVAQRDTIRDDADGDAVLTPLLSGDAADARFDFTRTTKTAAVLSGIDTILPARDSDNVTDRALRAYGEEVIRLNQGAAGSSDPLALPSDEVFADTLSEYTRDGFTAPSFAIDDINVIPDDADALLQYGVSVAEVYTTHSGNLRTHFVTAVYEAVFSNSTEPLALHVSALSNTLNGFLTLPVPSRFAAVHVALINIVQQKISIGNALLDSGNDPLRAVGGLTQLQDVLDDEAQLAAVLARISI